MQSASPSGRMVVGLDGSAGAQAALRWALRQAGFTGAGVHVVHAVRRLDAFEWAALPTNYGTVPTPVRYDHDEVRATAERLAQDTVRGAVAEDDAFGSVEVTIEVGDGHPGDLLLAAAKDADLLVLGRTGHGGFTGMRLGSVARHCVEHSTCGVTIIPPLP
ncbi:MAG TPA: universal stress protein [Pseudonocardiaceae bacterium]